MRETQKCIVESVRRKNLTTVRVKLKRFSLSEQRHPAKQEDTFSFESNFDEGYAYYPGDVMWLTLSNEDPDAPPDGEDAA